MKLSTTDDTLVVTAAQLAQEAGCHVAPDASAVEIVAAVMGAAPREIADVRPHSHGLVVKMADGSGSRYILCLEGSPDGEGRTGVLLAAPLRYKAMIPLFVEPTAKSRPKVARRRGPEKSAKPDPPKAADVRTAERELADIETAIEDANRAADPTGPRRFAGPDHNLLAGLSQRMIRAEAKLREARAAADAPRQHDEDVAMWSNAYQWARDLCEATAFNFEAVRREWVQRWPQSFYLHAGMCANEFEAATNWLSVNAPDELSRLVAREKATTQP